MICPYCYVKFRRVIAKNYVARDVTAPNICELCGEVSLIEGGRMWKFAGAQTCRQEKEGQ